MADMRHLQRDRQLQKVLAAKAKTKARGLTSAAQEDQSTALVIEPGPGVCRVHENNEERLVRCDVPVAPGDLVVVRHEKVAVVTTRKTTLSRADPSNPHRERTIAANIDLLVIVGSIADPPLRPGLVDRYLIAAHRGGVRPILCINKADLASKEALDNAARLFSVPVVRCSTVTGAGIEDLRLLLDGNLAVFAGHSGVGKSSLLNALLHSGAVRTGHVSEATGKGRHTTTSSRLVDLGHGTRIIDTPGIREFGLGRITLDELRAAFPEFHDSACRFAGCTHRSEPDCGIREGKHLRYGAWLRLASEL